MFTLKVADAKLFRDMISAISILVDEATFKIDPEGMKLRAMDPSRVAMIDFEWPKAISEEYTTSEPTKMCINVSELLKLLRRASKDEAVELSLDEIDSTFGFEPSHPAEIENFDVHEFAQKCIRSMPKAYL